VTVSDSRGNKYISAVQQAQSSDGHQVHIFYAADIAAGSNSVSAAFSGTNGHPWLAIFEYSGVSAANPLDVTSSAQGGDANPSSGNTPQTHASNELVFSGIGLPASSSVSVTAGNGESLLSQDPNAVGSRGAAEDEVVATTGSFSGSYVLSAPANWSAVVATFVAGNVGQTPLTISTTSLPQATQGSEYSAALSASGGTPPYSWTNTGSLPPGLSLTSTGSISGTPTSTGSYSFAIQVSDANGNSASQTLSIQVNPSVTTQISLLQSASAEGTSVSSLSQSLSTPNTAGDLIIVFVRMSSTSQTLHVTDTLGNAYNDAVSQTQSSDGHQIHILYARNIAAGANTITVSFSAANGHPWLSIYEYSGLSASTPLDKTAHAQGSSSSANSGLTPMTTSARELVFAGVGLPASSAQTVSAATGFILLQQNAPPSHSRAASEDAIVNSTGQYAGSFALSGAANWSALVATFRQ